MSTLLWIPLYPVHFTTNLITSVNISLQHLKKKVFPLQWGQQRPHCVESLTCVLVGRFLSIPESAVAVTGSFVSAPLKQDHPMGETLPCFPNSTGSQRSWMRDERPHGDQGQACREHNKPACRGRVNAAANMPRQSSARQLWAHRSPLSCLSITSSSQLLAQVIKKNIMPETRLFLLGCNCKLLIKGPNAW